MKKLTLAIIVSLVASLAVAQGPGGRPGSGGQDPKARMEKMAKDLNLSPDQKTKVMALRTKMQAEMKKLHDAPGDPKSKGPQMMKIFTSYGESVKKILKKDQLAKFEQMQKDRMARMGGRGGPGGPGGKGGPGGPPKAGGQ